MMSAYQKGNAARTAPTMRIPVTEVRSVAREPRLRYDRGRGVVISILVVTPFSAKFPIPANSLFCLRDNSVNLQECTSIWVG